MSDLLSIYNQLQAKRWVDLTHKINAESPHFPALPALKQEDLFTLKDGFHVQKFTVVGQYGTHIDAPIHFVEGGRWLDEIALKDLLLPLYVIDKSKEVAASPNFVLSKQDILDFEAEHGLVNEYYLLEQNIYQVEVLNQLDQVPAVGALISIAFPHWDKATGSPVRAVAILP